MRVEGEEDGRLFFITKTQLFIYIVHDLFNNWLQRPLDYGQEPKRTLPALPVQSRTFVSTRKASVRALHRTPAHVHPLAPESNVSFPSPSFNPRAEIMRRKISYSYHPQIGEMKICLEQRERPPWRLGLQFLSHIFLGGFMWQNTESCFVPPLVTLHPAPRVSFFFPFLLSGCLRCQPIAWHLLSCS